MIQSLRKKFIGATMLSLFLVMMLLLGAVSLVTHHKLVTDSDGLLHLLSENQGSFPAQMFPQPNLKNMEQGRPPFGNQGMSPETPYETRFFWVMVDEKDGTVFTDTASIAAIDEDMAEQFADKVLSSGKQRGFLGNYRYLVSRQWNLTRIIFLDCGRILSAFKAVYLAFFCATTVVLAGVFVLLLFLSGRIVKPVAESFEKQRQFITDAGHEIKTPLTIISADTDLLELEVGENEWLLDIRRQTQRLTDLTKDLIYLSRMDEARPGVQFVEFPMSDVVGETAQSFQSLAASQGRKLELSIQKLLSLVGSEKDICQLTSILLDNALKYSVPSTDIFLSLEQDAKSIRLTVRNSIQQPVSRETLGRLFDRFYRVDSSRNSSTGGYGLGLAIASGIVTAHRGKIRAESPEEHTLAITASFPVVK